MSRKPTEKEPDIHAAVDLIRQSAATGLKAVVDDVMKVCERDYAAVQTAMFLAYEDIALHALANTVLTEDDFVQAARGLEIRPHAVRIHTQCLETGRDGVGSAGGDKHQFWQHHPFGLPAAESPFVLLRHRGEHGRHQARRAHRRGERH